MGMAASQARYIALSARKTNIEYEGQQINQQRLALSNQSANLFNQMLGMEVPTAPSSNDFTKLQYSFSDGINTSVISSYQQLGVKDSDYNYAVTMYHYEKRYTGSRKLLNDPQIQATKVDHLVYDKNSADNNKHATINKIWLSDVETYGIQTKDGSTKFFRPANLDNLDMITAINYGLAEGNIAENQTVNLSQAEVIGKFKVCDENDLEVIKKIYNPTGTINPENYYKNDEGMFVTKAEYEAKADINTGKKFTTKGLDTGAGVKQTWYTDGTTFARRTELEKTLNDYNAGKKPLEVTYITTTNNPEFSNYTAIGNSPLTQLTEDDFKKESIKSEIEQIIKDMNGPQGSTSAAENFSKCFDAEGNYLGGIYTFQLAGVTYYTTDSDIQKSLKSAYEKNVISDNGIDNQQSKLAYFNAVYLDTRVEETKKALLETDGAGRFKTVRLEDDSVVYTLNVETVTDDVAYNDAMNRYYYKQQEYEKKLADINAKTEIIQAQDRTLELRLEQLNTEQSALQNEMEAVKKVVDKHIEQGFKTFGG